MSVRVQRISHATFETPDLERMIDYYVHIIGLSLTAREKDRAHLSTGTGLQALTLVQAQQARFAGLSFQIDPAGNLEDAAKELNENFGVSSARLGDSMPGMGDILSFTDCNGAKIDLFIASQRAAVDKTPKGILPLKLGHLALKTTDIEKSYRFYQDILGFKVSDWREDFFVWMRCGREHHTANFVRGDNIKMHHFAFELKDVSEIMRTCDFLASNNYKIIYGPGRHVIGDNVFIYHRNPDGQIVEFYAELAQIDSDGLDEYAPRPWQKDNPYRPKTWGPGTPGNLWGPGAPPGFADG